MRLDADTVKAVDRPTITHVEWEGWKPPSETIWSIGAMMRAKRRRSSSAGTHAHSLTSRHPGFPKHWPEPARSEIEGRWLDVEDAKEAVKDAMASGVLYIPPTFNLEDELKDWKPHILA